MTAPDVVYVVRPGQHNEELRYSLRSLRHLPHGKVWIAGFCPSWVSDEVGRIPVRHQLDRNVNAKANLRAACEHPEVSERFAYFNDDFFVMRPLTKLPVMHRGPLASVAQSGIMARAYTRAIRQTLELLRSRGIDEPLMYDLHAPMVVDKAGMLEALDLCSSPLIQERSVYGNLQGIGGELARNHKIRRGQTGWEGWAFLSTNDNTFATGPVGSHVRAALDDRSPYEREAPPTPRRSANVDLLRRPVRYRSSGGRVRSVA